LSVHCSSCGARLPPTSTFCPYCGTQIGGTETPDQSEFEASPGPWDAAPGGAQQEPPPQDASLGPEPEPVTRDTKKKKAPRSSLQEPPRPRMPMWQALPLWAAMLAVVGMLAWGGLHLWQTRDAVKTVTNHLNALMGKNYAAAYSLTAADFQQNTPEATYTAAVRGTRAFAYLAYYAIEDRNMATDWGIIKLVLVDGGGQHTQAAFDMVKEAGQWRIHMIRLGEHADADPQTIPVSTTQSDPNSDLGTEPDTTPQTVLDKQNIGVNVKPADDSEDEATSQTDDPAPNSGKAKDGTADKAKKN
jgi:hypothetical protein